MADEHPINKYERMAAGQRYGRLTAIEFIERRYTGSFWKFSCDCGGYTIARAAGVRKGQTGSCGCLQLTQNGMSRHPLWSRWHRMIMRCTDEAASDYARYGGRGITVCERWQSFENFLSDMEHKFFPGATLERSENNGGYSPENCKWATMREQSRNKRSNHIVSVDGKSLVLADAAEQAGLPYYLVSHRIQNGWSPERALATPWIKKPRTRLADGV